MNQEPAIIIVLSRTPTRMYFAEPDYAVKKLARPTVLNPKFVGGKITTRIFSRVKGIGSMLSTTLILIARVLRGYLARLPNKDLDKHGTRNTFTV